MSNPNNCETCDYMHYEHDGLHCYMFKDAPSDVCLQHTARELDWGKLLRIMDSAPSKEES